MLSPGTVMPRSHTKLTDVRGVTGVRLKVKVFAAV